MKQYDPKKIEPKWQKFWEKNKTFEVNEDSNKQKFYALIEFPYPSAAGLHVGHPRPFTVMDVISRKKRMEGYNVLYPIGFDAFGLPTENFAIKTGRPPAEVTKENIATFTRQLKSLGYSFDWERTVDTTDPEYYKWTQWIFLQFYKHGLAYKKNQPINWCPKDKTGLANEEVVQGCCERCGTPVEQRNKEQWMLAITKYADKLLEGLKEVDYINAARIQQENWIGKSEGAEVQFQLVIPTECKGRVEESLKTNARDSSATPQNDKKHSVTVFTTRPDTIFGVTFVAVSAELAQSWLKVGWGLSEKVKKYIEETAKERAGGARAAFAEATAAEEKTGVDTGIKAVNPANGEDVPVWVTNYVMGGVGTGAIMGVPAHDERDFEFAKKFGLPIKQVVAPYVIHDGTETPRSDENIFQLDAASAIIKHWEKELFYVVYFTDLFQGFVGGRVEIGEKKIETARREATEESGYTDVKSVETLFDHAFSRGYKTRKSREEICHDAFFIVQLASDARAEIIDKETKKGKWMTAEEILRMSTFSPAHKLSFEHYIKNKPFTGEGKLVNSGKFDGLMSEEAKKKITEAVGGQMKTNFKLRDWVFSRQRYWGEPIPLVHCEKCAGWIPLPESELPLKLPKVEKYEPTDNGESPLATIEKWVNTKCPKCGGKARRETDTMPNWAGSSWYFLRYLDAKNNKDFFKTPSFNFRPAITPTEKDSRYFEEFKDIFIDLKKENIQAWASNRFMLNGLNRSLWLPLRTVAFMSWKKDCAWIAGYLKKRGYKLTEPNIGGDLYEKGDIRVEVIPLHNENGKLHSFTRRGTRQDMVWGDFPDAEFGNLFGFSFLTISPKYNLEHYKFIVKHEAKDREGLGDQDKIDFLEEWVGSKNAKILYWNQVDWYNGGMEHTVLHLLYSRFWNQFLYDLGLVPTREPYKKRTSHGMILGPDGEKMSKSRGNVINPDEMVEKFGTDAFRMYIMFMGPFDQAVMWDTNGLVGVRRFLDKVWNLQENVIPTESEGRVEESLKTKARDSSTPLRSAQNDKTTTILHQTIKKVTEDIDKMSFNTAVSKMMELANHFTKEQKITTEEYGIFAKLLSPFAPHIAEEIWTEVLGNKKSLAYESWPVYDEALTHETTLTIALQINGKVRDTIEIAADATEESVKQAALASEKVQKWLEGKAPKKIIYVKGKLISIVI